MRLTGDQSSWHVDVRVADVAARMPVPGDQLTVILTEHVVPVAGGGDLEVLATFLDDPELMSEQQLDAVLNP